MPSRKLGGSILHRVYLRSRTSPWWFASIPAGGAPEEHGRFDLPAPDGACYLATSVLAATLEAMRDFSQGLLPDVELLTRCCAVVKAPRHAPPAAWLTASRARGVGVTGALWAGDDRRVTQLWAVALRRAGWLALYHGIQHDPSGRLRAVTLFDEQGDHPPYGDPRGWDHADHDLHDDEGLRAGLARYGITVTRSDPDLPIVPLDESGLI